MPIIIQSKAEEGKFDLRGWNWQWLEWVKMCAFEKRYEPIDLYVFWFHIQFVLALSRIIQSTFAQLNRITTATKRQTARRTPVQKCVGSKQKDDQDQDDEQNDLLEETWAVQKWARCYDFLVQAGTKRARVDERLQAGTICDDFVQNGAGGWGTRFHHFNCM